MKTRIILISLLIIPALMAIGQRASIELTFTADNNGTHVQLDSIKVMNRTQDCDTMLYYPDTVLLALYYTGIPDINTREGEFQVFRNYPNPVADQTTISLFIPDKDRVIVSITDMAGRSIYTTERILDQGIHSFRFMPAGGGLYFFTARWRQTSRSIKIVGSPSNRNRAYSLEYTGSEEIFPPYKTTADIKGFTYSIGDTLLYIGYADDLESGILDTPEENKTYTFQFATNIPCPGTPMVEYEGQVYNTIQIFSQCWLKENLNVGTMIQGTEEMTDNGIIEKYCYNNEPDSCTKYGGLYQWNEMMQYTTQQGVQGICPPGWYLPTDEDWKVLEGAVDSQYGIGDNIWEGSGLRGYDAGTNLKSTSGWYSGGDGTDHFGFSGLPGASRYNNGSFAFVGWIGYWYTSTEYVGSEAWFRAFLFNGWGVEQDNGGLAFGLSVRCLRDEVYIPTIELTFTAVNNSSYIELDSIKVMNRTQGEEILIYWPDTTLVVPGNLAFTPGDELLYIGYADTLQSGILDAPEESKTYTFQFATNIPCPGTPMVEYEGQVYNTIQIFSQCWLKENLNVGTMIQGTEEMTDNGIIEKYCYNNEPDSCTKYGGLYQWNEMMQYTTHQGMQGICPPDWHLPTDEEWKVMEGAVDSQYGIGNSLWSYDDYRGYDAGTKLKTTSGWDENGNGTDLFGFSGLPGGFRFSNGGFIDVGIYGEWWSSTDYLFYAWLRSLCCDSPKVGRYFYGKDFGFSVRCLRDN